VKSKENNAASKEAQGLKSDKISKKDEDVTSSKKTTSINKDVAKGPELIDILNDIQNVRIPIAEVPVDTSTDNTSPNKRASNRAKLAKEKEETLRMYVERSKKCDAEVDAIIDELDGAAKTNITDTNTGSLTDTVWIQTKNKAKVLPDTTSKSTATDEPTKRKTIRLADEQIRQIAYKGGVRTNFIGDKNTKANSSNSEPEIVGVLDYLVRVGINKRSEKLKSTDPKPRHNTPVKVIKKATQAKETSSKECIK